MLFVCQGLISSCNALHLDGMFHLPQYFIARTFNQVCHTLGFACGKTLNKACCFVDGLVILALYQVFRCFFLMNYCVIESTERQILVRKKN